jgi:hypothetical protein
MALAQTIPVMGQDRLFGSRDDPAEQPNQAWWQREQSVAIFGGLSLIGPQWRSEARINAGFRSARFSGRLEGTIRTGIYGTYRPDIDEPYDLLRLVDYIRYRPRRSRVYLRIGALDRTRLGTGHIVNFLSTRTTWDRRTVGVEGSATGPIFQLNAFTDNVTLSGVVGGRLAITPFGRSRNRRLRSVTLAVNGVMDRSRDAPTDERFRGQHIEFQFEAVHSGPLNFKPFVSYARTRQRGQGLFLGADFGTDNFVDVARLHFRLALQYNSRRFVPGYVGAFWGVRNPAARIVEAVPEQGEEPIFAGRAISGIYRSRAVVTEFRLLLFERFEFWYQFIRNYGIQDLSEMHTRIFLQARRFRLAVGQDRGGLGGFLSLFDELGSINALRFESSYRIAAAIWLRIDARYTYERIDSADSQRWFIVQRRFDPLLGLRLTL